VSQPTPAIVAQSAVRRLPRWGLVLLGLAYILPGFLGRTPWKADDIEAFGFMLQLAQTWPGEAVSWLKPTLMLQADTSRALLPYWLGAWMLKIVPAAWAAWAVRVPFMLLLALTFLCTWYAVYALARNRAAQPVAFAFGGEAQPRDYARALADGGLLALMATLGLARLSHETTPVLCQLAFSALLFWGLASLSRQRGLSLLGVACGMLGLTLSGAPSLALILGLGGTLVRALAPPGPDEQRTSMLDLGLLALICLVSACLAGGLNLWQWRLLSPTSSELRLWGRLLLWFTWPTWPLVLWTLWRWRLQLRQVWKHLHLALPLWFAASTVLASALTAPNDRALLMSLPASATLAAFALPTLRRSVGAFIDWFTLLFFTGCALIIWGVWLSMQTGIPAQPAANVARLAPDFTHSFSLATLTPALLMTVLWLALVRWRTGRHRTAIWKSLVLPACGATLCWLLLMTLWLPLLDHGRSYAPLVQRMRQVTGPADCVQYFGLSKAQGTALRFHGQLRLEPASAPRPDCAWLVVEGQSMRHLPTGLLESGWTAPTRLRRPTDSNEDIVVFRAAPPAPSAAQRP
jgi:hypothetical protein